VTTPVAIMTSDAKGNHSRISRLLADNNWFGRTHSSYRLFRWGGVYVRVCVGRGGGHSEA